MRLFTLLVAMGAVVAGHANARADTWCYTNYPDAVFCDDFDRYCEDPPPEPQECPVGAPGSYPAMEDVWNHGYSGAIPCSRILVNDGFVTSSPYAASSPNQPIGNLARSRVTLKTYCQAAFGLAYTSVMGTDLNPLILEFVIDGQTVNKINFANNYMELGYGASKASTDYRLANCGGEDYPIICQQQGAPADCPPLSTAPHLMSLAVGALAYLDAPPCYPSNLHLSFFDGYQWWVLEQGLFTGSGDFLLRNSKNYIRMTIKTSTVKVELTCTDPNPDEYSWCTIPRDYLGQFNYLYAGYKAPCQLKAGEWECRYDAKCIKGSPGGGTPRYDNVALDGGQGYGAPGACCYEDTNCTHEYYMDCQTLGGEFQGSGTSCYAVACCPPLPPDHDMDTDVDLDDFAWFQTCLSGPDDPPPTVPCECADLTLDDGHVDANDLATFLGCMRGPGLAADPNCAD